MPMYKKSFFVLLVIALISTLVTYYRLNTQDNEIPLTNNTNIQTQIFTIYVTGEVNTPGVIQLSSDKTIADAVEACNGFTPLADKNKINLAQKITDGLQIIVPAKIAENNASTLNTTAENNALVNINTATKEQLDSLPGVGPSTAQKIIDYRQEHGAFQKIDDLKEIKGIGDAKFNKLKTKITI